MPHVVFIFTMLEIVDQSNPRGKKEMHYIFARNLINAELHEIYSYKLSAHNRYMYSFNVFLFRLFQFMPTERLPWLPSEDPSKSFLLEGAAFFDAGSTLSAHSAGLLHPLTVKL